MFAPPFVDSMELLIMHFFDRIYVATAICFVNKYPNLEVCNPSAMLKDTQEQFLVRKINKKRRVLA